jgi:hypothetical protein
MAFFFVMLPGSWSLYKQSDLVCLKGVRIGYWRIYVLVQYFLCSVRPRRQMSSSLEIRRFKSFRQGQSWKASCKHRWQNTRNTTNLVVCRCPSRNIQQLAAVPRHLSPSGAIERFLRPIHKIGDNQDGKNNSWKIFSDYDSGCYGSRWTSKAFFSHIHSSHHHKPLSSLKVSDLRKARQKHLLSCSLIFVGEIQ